VQSKQGRIVEYAIAPSTGIPNLAAVISAFCSAWTQMQTS
jgi:hypothetical protein